MVRMRSRVRIPIVAPYFEAYSSRIQPLTAAWYARPQISLSTCGGRRSFISIKAGVKISTRSVLRPLDSTGVNSRFGYLPLAINMRCTASWAAGGTCLPTRCSCIASSPKYWCIGLSAISCSRLGSSLCSPRVSCRSSPGSVGTVIYLL